MKKQLCLIALGFACMLRAETSQEFVTKSMEAARGGKFQEAETLATKAIETDAVNWKAYFLRAQIRSRLRQHAQSAEDLSKLIEHDPKQAQTYQLRGMEYFRAGEMDKSIADFDKFISFSPKEEAQHWQRGIAYYYAGRYQEGKKQFELHQTVNPSDVENAIFHFICSAKVDGFDKARENLIQITDDRRVPMKELQALYAGKGSAEEVLKAAVAGEPGEEEKKNRLFYAHLYLGLFYEAKGEQEKAKEHIKQSATTYAQHHYMGDVARVHWKKLSAEKAK